ncbi:MAG: c(7)-type cytochrome triheme domain-containing protein [Thermodesulfobacteriota bacterium]
MIRALIAALVFSVALPALASGANIGNLKLDDRIESMKKAGVGPVIFPHTKHEKANPCKDCHPKIFKKKRGTSGITMKLNMEGKFCGSPSCHNSPKAFPLYMCTNCHTHVTGAAK